MIAISSHLCQMKAKPIQAKMQDKTRAKTARTVERHAFAPLSLPFESGVLQLTLKSHLLYCPTV